MAHFGSNCLRHSLAQFAYCCRCCNCCPSSPSMQANFIHQFDQPALPLTIQLFLQQRDPYRICSLPARHRGWCGTDRDDESADESASSLEVHLYSTPSPYIPCISCHRQRIDVPTILRRRRSTSIAAEVASRHYDFIRVWA